jgi:hypothetical protein
MRAGVGRCRLLGLLYFAAVSGRVPGRGVADHGPSLPLRSRPVRAAASLREITAGPGPASLNRTSGEGDSGRDLGIPPA